MADVDALLPPLPDAPLEGLHHLSRGKVRDLYAVDDDHLLLVASDRVSVFDTVLATPVPGKGAVLTALTVFWLDRLAGVAPHHLVSADVADFPAQVQPHADVLRGRSMLCRRLDMVPLECVARGYLTGSGLADYRASGTVGGVPLPGGLGEAARLDEPVFSPATKAPQGEHDENVAFHDVVTAVGAETAGLLRDVTTEVYRRAAAHASSVGLLLADTKLEMGRDPRTGALTLADEVLTPDSSRYWEASAWAPGSTPPPWDKQLVRDWVRDSGWRDGDLPPRLPGAVVAATQQRYLAVCERLTGRPLAAHLAAG